MEAVDNLARIMLLIKRMKVIKKDLFTSNCSVRKVLFHLYKWKIG